MRNTSSIPRLHYAYVIVVLSFLIGAVAWGTQRTFGVFLEPLLKEFQWSRATASLAITIQGFVTGLMSIPAGRLNDRFGPRIVLTICGLLIGAGYILLSQLHSLWQLYLWQGVLIGIGMAGIMVPLTSLVVRWFTRQAGLMNGIVHSGLGLGITIIPPIAAWLITGFTWPKAYLILGATLLVLIVTGSQFLKRGPAYSQPLMHGNDPAPPPPTRAVSLTFRGALSTRTFWLLCLVFFADVFTINTVMVHIVVHGRDTGLTAAQAVSVLSVTAAVSIAGRIGAGALADRIGMKWAISIGFGMVLLSFVWLLFARELWMFYVFAAAFGIGGWSAGAVMAPLVAGYFGLKSHGVILGAVTFAGTLGGALGPLLAGTVFDIMGNYSLAFGICAALAAAGLVTLAFLKPAAQGGKS